MRFGCLVMNLSVIHSLILLLSGCTNNTAPSLETSVDASHHPMNSYSSDDEGERTLDVDGLGRSEASGREVERTSEADMYDQEELRTDLDVPVPIDQGIRSDLHSDQAGWQPLELSRVNAYAIPNSAKIFAEQHPDYSTIPELITQATSNILIRIEINIYLIDSSLWTDPDQLSAYLALVKDYFIQARIQLRFTFKEGPAPAWTEEINQVHLYFTHAMRNPRGALPQGFGNLPAGKAVINDHLMDRPQLHDNPLFLPGKPIGHEIGHVLGLPHVSDRRYLMAQGTSAENQLQITAEEAVIMRVMALFRFGATIQE